MTWDDIKRSWSDGWNSLWSEAQSTWRSLVEKNPTHYKPRVEAFVNELAISRKHLDAMKARLPTPARTPEELALVQKYQDLEKRYQAIAAGFYAETKPAGKTDLGWLPLLLVGGLAVSAGAAAWAIPGYQYAVNLREQTTLAARELEARVAASKEGRTLQQATLPPPPPAPSPAGLLSGIGGMVLVAVVAVAGVAALPQLMKKS